MATPLLVVLAVAALLALGYVLAMRVLLKQSREEDKHVDFSKIRPWKDDED